MSWLVVPACLTDPASSGQSLFRSEHESKYFSLLNSIKQPQSLTSKVSPEVIAETANGAIASVVILLAEQADLSAAYQIKDQDARGWYVYDRLTENANRTQASLKSFLNSRQINFKSFWAANMIVATVDSDTLNLIAARKDVARIDSNSPTRWIEEPAIAKPVFTASETSAIEGGVMSVRAPEVWALGFTGQGIVIGSLDTGVRWTHNSLKSKYRGWNGTTAVHSYNWHDAIHSGGGICGFDTQAPCDDDGHGTHTVGTMLGDDGAGNQIGVAPGARWIGCRNMDQGNGTPATYTECFQFAIAPTDLNGHNPNPALRPHILNNSWSCPTSEGCTTRAELETIVNNTQAAGIFVSAAAGNAGPGCGTVSQPPAIYDATFSVGAIDGANFLANFSSRGPSSFYTSALLKPNISAPGVAVRSSYRSSDTTYTNLSGTSMASPHVAGVVALLWSARPELLRNIAATKDILQNTANPNVSLGLETCGGISSNLIPNNSFGYGRVDALAAVNARVDPMIQFSSSNYSASEGAGRLDLAVTRTGDSSGSSSVSFTTSDLGASSKCDTFDGHASSRCDYVTSAGILNFAPGETSKTFSILIADDSYAEGNESFTVNLNNASGGILGMQSTTTVTIIDNDSTNGSNPLDQPGPFVTAHYLDFLSRQPDSSGLDFWTKEITSCGNDQSCVDLERINVSAAFFLSIEFQQTGYLVERLYRTAFGDATGQSSLNGNHQLNVPMVRFSEFLTDSEQIGQGVSVGQMGWDTLLESNKAVFVDQFVRRSKFASALPATMTPPQFVDQLDLNAGHVLSSSERNAAINLFANANDTSNLAARAQALRQIAEDSDLQTAEFNRAFVLMQYFGYLRRNPNDSPDADYAGFDFWLSKLNQFNGDYNQAEMVKAFITSSEYRQRFGP